MARVGRFSTTSSLECDWFIAAGNLLFLSGQQLLGCDTVDSACNGVFVDNGFVVAENDPCTEASYSYITIKGIGKASSCTVDRPGKCRGIRQTGPSFQSCSSGVLTASSTILTNSSE